MLPGCNMSFHTVPSCILFLSLFLEPPLSFLSTPTVFPHTCHFISPTSIDPAYATLMLYVAFGSGRKLRMDLEVRRVRKTFSSYE